MMKFAALLMLTSAVSFADSTIATKFSFSEEAQSFGTAVQNGETVKIEYVVKELAKPVIDDSILQVSEEQECVYWTYQGTSPDDPGVCGEYRNTGKYLLTTKGVAVPLYSVTEIVTDLKTGVKKSKRLENVIMNFYLEGGYKKLNSREIPADLNLKFTSLVISSPLFGCAVNDTFKASPLLGEATYLGVCTSFMGSATVEKIDGKYSYNVAKTLKVEVGVYGFWMVKDFPRSNYVSKDIWPGSMTSTLALEIK